MYLKESFDGLLQGYSLRFLLELFYIIDVNIHEETRYKYPYSRRKRNKGYDRLNYLVGLVVVAFSFPSNNFNFSASKYVETSGLTYIGNNKNREKRIS